MKCYIFSLTVIIKTITLSVTYCSLMWWPPERSIGGVLSLTIFLVLSGLVMFNFFSAISFGAGFVPQGWEPVCIRPLEKKLHEISPSSIFLYHEDLTLFSIAGK